MNSLYLKTSNIIASALIGLNLGFFLALIMVQWTWLELRVNVGLLILVGLLIGLVYGLLKSIQRPLFWGVSSVILLTMAALVICKGKLGSAQILLGSVLREGILISSLPLGVATFLIAGILFLTVLVSGGLEYFRCSGNEQ